MITDCTRAIQARGELAPLECRTLIDSLGEDFSLTDVVFELADHPNGFRSRACGFVWNAMPGQWSRRLVGGHVDDLGRQYHFETGLVCPRGSRLSVCTCFFVNQPTSRLWALLSGYLCQDSRPDVSPADLRELQTIDWTDPQPTSALDPLAPTRRGPRSADQTSSIPTRELLGTARTMAEADQLWIEGAEGRSPVASGTTIAMRVGSSDVDWASGDTKATVSCPEGTNLIVVRRAADGRSVHWICYREERYEATR